MSAPTPSPELTDAAPKPSRRRTVVASAVVGALVLSGLFWAGSSAMQAVAADERREALRVDALTQLLVDRSQSNELLAAAAVVIDVVSSAAPAAASSEAHDALAAAHATLSRELQRELTRDTAHQHIIAQSRLLEGAKRALMVSIDAQVRSVLSAAQAAKAASPLATAATVEALDTAVDALTGVRQGLPSSYSGRAKLVGAVLTSAATVVESHAAEKAEQERLEAERIAAEEAARRSSSGSRGGSGGFPYEWFDQKMRSEGCVLLWRNGDTSQWDCPPGHWTNPFPPQP